MKIFGGGRARAVIQKPFEDWELKPSGWVKDLNTELLSFSAFLVLTSAPGFNVGNMMILLAWSLGVRVITHSSSALSMTDMVHNKNALLAVNKEDFAALMSAIATNKKLRERIALAVQKTFQRYYSSKEVALIMLKQIESAANEFYREKNWC